jgi:hypothetical protein
MFYEETLAAPHRVIPAQAGTPVHPQRTAGQRCRRHAHGARCGAVWVPTFEGTTLQMKLMPKAV